MVNSAEPLSRMACSQPMSVTPQKMRANPVKTRNSHTAWNASSVRGGRIASTRSRKRYERFGEAILCIGQPMARAIQLVSRTRLGRGSMKLRMAASSTHTTSPTPNAIATTRLAFTPRRGAKPTKQSEPEAQRSKPLGQPGE